MDSGFDVNRMEPVIKPASLKAAVIAFSVLLGFNGCFPDPLEISTVPQAADELVVSSQIVPDSSLLVLLTRTFGALDASDDSDPHDLLDLIAVNDAVVYVAGPAGTDTLESLGDGAYGGVPITFKEGETYSLHIYSPEFGDVSATTEVKSKVSFDEVSAELFYNGYDDTLAQITYSFHDAPGLNYYMINVQEVEREDAIENLLNPRAFTVLFDDSRFSGNSVGERFRVYPRDYEPGDTIAVSLANISYEYYEFMKLRIDNRYSLVEFVAEPVNYPSNVVGGKGYFNLYVPDFRFFVFD